VSELREGASALLTCLADHLRRPHLELAECFTDLKEGIVDLLSKAIEAGENPENEIDFSVQNAKENLAVLLEYYAKELQGGTDLRKLLTHPALTGFAKATLDAVGAAK
ncbi:MAG: hypothetical protein JSV16_05710, partial [Candidatus Hydrogenedentota bacterium]